MNRRIITRELQAGEARREIDTYFARIVKYIPADIVGAWVAVTGLIASSANIPTDLILWIAFAIGVILTAIWTWQQTSLPHTKPAITQIVISSGAFIVWVFALGGPFATIGFYRPLYGSLLLIFYTLLVALVVPSEH